MKHKKLSFKPLPKDYKVKQINRKDYNETYRKAYADYLRKLSWMATVRLRQAGELPSARELYRLFSDEKLNLEKFMSVDEEYINPDDEYML